METTASQPSPTTITMEVATTDCKVGAVNGNDTDHADGANSGKRNTPQPASTADIPLQADSVPVTPVRLTDPTNGSGQSAPSSASPPSASSRVVVHMDLPSTKRKRRRVGAASASGAAAAFAGPTTTNVATSSLSSTAAALAATTIAETPTKSRPDKATVGGTTVRHSSSSSSDSSESSATVMAHTASSSDSVSPSSSSSEDASSTDDDDDDTREQAQDNSNNSITTTTDTREGSKPGQQERHQRRRERQQQFVKVNRRRRRRQQHPNELSASTASGGSAASAADGNPTGTTRRRRRRDRETDNGEVLRSSTRRKSSATGIRKDEAAPAPSPATTAERPAQDSKMDSKIVNGKDGAPGSAAGYDTDATVTTSNTSSSHRARSSAIDLTPVEAGRARSCSPPPLAASTAAAHVAVDVDGVGGNPSKRHHEYMGSQQQQQSQETTQKKNQLHGVTTHSGRKEELNQSVNDQKESLDSTPEAAAQKAEVGAGPAPASAASPGLSIKQPDGWRVKLYRLNETGSWDDCGTGRILCLVTPPPSPTATPLPNSHPMDTEKTVRENPGAALLNRGQISASDEEEKAGLRNVGDNVLVDATMTIGADNQGQGGDGNPHASSQSRKDQAQFVMSEEQLYRELGEPTLCMHAEIPPNEGSPEKHQQVAAPPTSPRVILRTRVLLRPKSYQRQGDNIITWCEPTASEDEKDAGAMAVDQQGCGNGLEQSNGDDEDEQQSAGVDLALSFQDNAGCLDIWNQIEAMQRRAEEIVAHASVGRHLPDEASGALQGRSEGTGSDGGTSSESDKRTGGGDTLRAAAPSSGTAGGNPLAHGVHSGTLRQSRQRPTWIHVEGEPPNGGGSVPFDVDVATDHGLRDSSVEAAAVSMAAAAAAAYDGEGIGAGQPRNLGEQAANGGAGGGQLPNPPTVVRLDEIADIIAGAQMQQREEIALFVLQNDCSYLKALLGLFPSAEGKDDYNALATLAACVKAILLLNDPGIIDMVGSDGEIFEDVCSVLEYDPDLRHKANHRWFIRERVRFRTVIPMKDDELVAAIHKSFRFTYLRDTLLRPTMDESSLSALASLVAFTHADVVRGVMSSPPAPNSKEEEDGSENPRNTSTKKRESGDGDGNEKADNTGRKGGDSYLVEIIRLFGIEVTAIRELEWEESKNIPVIDDEARPPPSSFLNNTAKAHPMDERRPHRSKPPSTSGRHAASPWQQHLAPQDSSLLSRKTRRRGALSFLRELFEMVRASLQPSDKDDFYAMIVLMDVAIGKSEIHHKEGKEGAAANTNVVNSSSDDVAMNDGEPSSGKAEAAPAQESVNLIGLLAAIFSDQNTDVSERSAGLEILSTIVMQDPSLIRRHCLDVFAANQTSSENNTRSKPSFAQPDPNRKRQVLFTCPPDDLLLSLVFLLAVETDAGILLQTSEVIRMLLDTEMVGDQGPMGNGLLDNEEEMAPSGSVFNGTLGLGPGSTDANGGGGSEQNSFISMFFEHYVHWLIAPFQYAIMVTPKPMPLVGSDAYIRDLQQTVKDEQKRTAALLNREVVLVTMSPMRQSFGIELLSFCVRAHCYKMKFVVLRTRLLGTILDLLNPKSKFSPSVDRCLCLAAIRFLRAILSVKDEFYHRHIVQHNLFAPVFEAFRANPIGDNLVSSAIVEMCDFIKTENFKSLLEYIVSNHLCPEPTDENGSYLKSRLPSLEEVSTPYVDTLTQMRAQHEENTASGPKTVDKTAMRSTRIGLSARAQEDQRKFREADEEESYFRDDDGEDPASRGQHGTIQQRAETMEGDGFPSGGVGNELMGRTRRILGTSVVDRLPRPGHDLDAEAKQEISGEDTTGDSLSSQVG